MWAENLCGTWFFSRNVLFLSLKLLRKRRKETFYKNADIYYNTNAQGLQIFFIRICNISLNNLTFIIRFWVIYDNSRTPVKGARDFRPLRRKNTRGRLTLTLFVALVFRANNHNFAVSFNYLALVAHGFNRRSDFHNSPLNNSKLPTCDAERIFVFVCFSFWNAK